MRLSNREDQPHEEQLNRVRATHVVAFEEYRGELEHHLNHTLGTDFQDRLQAAEDAVQSGNFNRGHKILEDTNRHMHSEVSGAMRPGYIEATSATADQDLRQIKQDAKAHIRKQLQTQRHEQGQTP